MSAGGSAPKPATFIPTNIGQDISLAQQYDTLGYQLSDSAFLSQFPGLASLRAADITSTTNDVTGPLDPTVENTFASSAENNALSSFGGGQGSIGTAGSAARGAIGAGIANQTQAKQDADRLALQNIIAANPQRQIGLTGGDAVNLMIANILGENQSRYAGYASGVQTSNAQSAAQQQEAFAGAGLAISLAGVLATAL